MAGSVDVLCGLCDDQEITKYAEHWCPECEEGYCIDCLKFHKSLKATKHHEVISVENLKKLPTSISSIVHHCKEHDKRYQNYCPHHESLCCPVCISTLHNKCNDLLVIDDFIKNAKSSSLLESIEESIDFLKRNLQLLLEERDQTLLKNKLHREDFLNNLKNLREKINVHFDKLEEHILQTLSVTEKQIKDQIENVSKYLQQKVTSVEELEHDVISVKEYGSELQTCLGSMSLRTRIEEEENYLKSFDDDGKLKQVLLKCSFDDKLLESILEMKTFGSISTIEIPSTVNLSKQGKKRAQISLGRTLSLSKSIYEINLSLKCKFEIPVGVKSTNLTGCFLKPDGKIMLIDRSNSRLMIHREDGELNRTMNLARRFPTDITLVDEKTMCVTYSNDNSLMLFNIDSYEYMKSIRTSRGCCGISFENETLYWYEQQIGIQMKHQSSDDITTLVKAEDDCYWCYVSVYDGRIYQTNQEQKTVSCFKLDGQKIWEYKDDAMLKCPQSIAVDKASNIYVADYSNGIYILSPDGKNCRQILGTESMICYSIALCFSRKQNLLTVSNYNGQVFVYRVL